MMVLFVLQNKNCLKAALLLYGVPEVIRTLDRTLRRRMLYPAELRGQLN